MGVEAGWLFDVGLVFHEYVAGSVRCDLALILVFVLLDPPQRRPVGAIHLHLSVNHRCHHACRSVIAYDLCLLLSWCGGVWNGRRRILILLSLQFFNELSKAFLMVGLLVEVDQVWRSVLDRGRVLGVICGLLAIHFSI